MHVQSRKDPVTFRGEGPDLQKKLDRVQTALVGDQEVVKNEEEAIEHKPSHEEVTEVGPRKGVRGRTVDRRKSHPSKLRLRKTSLD